MTADARESIRRDTATLATAVDRELKESDPFADVEEDEDELEENKKTANPLYFAFYNNHCIVSVCFDIAIESQTRAHVLLEY